MKVDVKLAGNSYSGVPAVLIPLKSGGKARFCEVSDTTATAEDVLAGKTFYSREGELTEGKAVSGTATTGDVMIQSEKAWKVNVVQPEHARITAVPVAGLTETGGAWKTTLSIKATIDADTGYIPGTISRSVGTDTITVTATESTPVEGLVKDGWALVYMDGNGGCYLDKEYKNFVETTSGNILVAGMENTEVSGHTEGNDRITGYRNSLMTKAEDFFLQRCVNLSEVHVPNMTYAGRFFCGGTGLTVATFENLETCEDWFLEDCKALKSVTFKSLKKAGDRFLNGCKALERITVLSDSVPLMDGIGRIPRCQLCVPEHLVEAYKADKVWGTPFKGRISHV